MANSSSAAGAPPNESVASQGLMQPNGGSTGAPFNFKGVLQQMVQQSASDLHLKVGRPPTLRVNGDLVALQLPAMKPEDLKSLAEQVMSPKQVKEFAEHKEADFAIGVPRSEEHTSELQSRRDLVCRLLPENKNNCTLGSLRPAFRLVRHLAPAHQHRYRERYFLDGVRDPNYSQSRHPGSAVGIGRAASRQG